MHDSWFQEFDADKALDQFPLGDQFTRRFAALSSDELREMQNAQFLALIKRGWQIPFYQRLWGGAGIEPGDVTSIDDLQRLPTFDKSHLMESIENNPPYGDFHGLKPGDRAVVHTTTGTTGRPQTLLYGVHSREIQNLLLARAYIFQGMQSDDVVHSIYGFGMVNGGHYVREAILHFTRATLLPAGTGRDTPSVRQVELMRDFSVTALVGFADYMRKLAETAIEQGIQPGSDIPLRMISGHMGRESKSLISQLWGGAEVFDWYGVGDTGTIAAEGPDHDGLYLWEDAHIVEVLDPESGDAVVDGAAGNLVDTVLFKQDIYPIIRFNTQDVTRVLPGRSSLGLNLRRIEGFLGRSDNMVKLRGINVFPHAFAGWIAEFESLNGEYLCIVTRDDQGRDDLSLHVETTALADSQLARRVAGRIRDALGIAVQVILQQPGSLAPQTQIEHRQKAIRLIDQRFEND